MASLYGTLPDIACCLCGSLVKSNGANMCMGCLGEKYQICTPLKELNPDVLMCKKCGKWRIKHGSGKGTRNETWAHADLESQELMSICLKQGIEHTITKFGLELMDARFEWSEPHSRRLRVRVVVRKHISELPNGGVTLQGQSTVEIVIKTRQCNECAAENSTGGGEPWRTVVQVRQRVNHKKTLIRMEQEALAAGVTEKCLGIEQMRDGLDLYFLDTPTATRFVDWAKAQVPLKSKTSKKLVSTDIRSNLNHFKYTNVLEIVPLCRDDLVYVDKKSPLRSRLPGLHLVTRVASTLKLIQIYPPTFRSVELTAEQYFRAPFDALMSADDMTSFTLLDNGADELTSLERNTGDENNDGDVDDDDAVSVVSEATTAFTSNGIGRTGSDVLVARTQDVGLNSFACHTHLSGPKLGKPGDICLGYDLEGRNFGEDFLETFSDYPSAILVKREKAKDTKSKKSSMKISQSIASVGSGGALAQVNETVDNVDEDRAAEEEKEIETISEQFKKLSSKEKRKLKRETRKAQQQDSALP